VVRSVELSARIKLSASFIGGSTQEKISCGKASANGPGNSAILAAWRSPAHAELDDSKNNGGNERVARCDKSADNYEDGSLNQEYTDHNCMSGLVV